MQSTMKEIINQTISVLNRAAHKIEDLELDVKISDERSDNLNYTPYQSDTALMEDIIQCTDTLETLLENISEQNNS